MHGREAKSHILKDKYHRFSIKLFFTNNSFIFQVTLIFWSDYENDIGKEG